MLLVAALHARVLRLPFFADDYLFLEQVRGRSLGAALASRDPLGNFFRPVSRALYFWVVGRMGGESPVLFHAIGLALFLAALAVLHAIVRRRLGWRAGFVAVAFVGLGYAADVPLMWASGAQDLLAVLLAALAVHLHASGRRTFAATALLLALLSKEVVLGAPLIAIVADHRDGERWRATAARAWMLALAGGAWAALWLATPALRPTAGQTLSWSPGNAPAAFVHLAQAALGLEFRLGGVPLGHWGWSAAGLALASVAGLAWLERPGREGGRAPDPASRRAMLRLGLAWTALGTLPLIPVAAIWSAYHYLWALCGVAVLLAALAAGWSAPARGALLAALVLLSGEARALDEFGATGGAWSWQSHVNRRYLDRGFAFITRYLRQMRAQRPTLPPRSTVLFDGVAPSSGWQAADGPLLRWAYRDTTLRSYYLTRFDAALVRRGPVLFFTVIGDSLVDVSDDPRLLPSLAFSMLLEDQPRQACDALELAIARAPDVGPLHYWRALAEWSLGDSSAAARDLTAAGMRARRGWSAAAARSLAAAAGDPEARLRALERMRDDAALDPWLHASLAVSALGRGAIEEGVIEAYAGHVLAPEDPGAWRRWAAAQLAARREAEGMRSLERYFALAGAGGRADTAAHRTFEALERRVQGDLAKRALRRDR